MSKSDKPTVLVVEDEQALIELYVRWLESEYDVRTARGGEEALEEFDQAIDMVLLDRLMPGMSGDEVLEAVRERSSECKVAMVTAVEPDFDVLRMGFDDYLTKPIDREELRRTVERLVDIDSYDALYIRLSSLRVLRNVLQEEKSAAELAADERFQELEEHIAELEAEVGNIRRDVMAGVG